MSVRELTSKFVLAFFSTSRVLDTAKKKSTQMMNPHQHIRCYINKQSKAVTTTHFPSVLHLEEDRSSPVFLCAICRGPLFTWFIASLNAPSFNLSESVLTSITHTFFTSSLPHFPPYIYILSHSLSHPVVVLTVKTDNNVTSWMVDLFVRCHLLSCTVIGSAVSKQ